MRPERLRTRPDLEQPWDLIVVPGCRVRPDGQPGQALRARLRQALWCWQAGLGKQLAVSGRGEASCGAAWLLQRGLPPPALVLEHRAQNTRENARFLAKLTGPLRLLVITQDFHATRCARSFARHFEEVKVLPLPSPWRARLPAELREGAARLRDRIEALSAGMR